MKPFTLNLCKAQVQDIKRGGFIFSIPAILAGIGAIGSLAGGASAIAKAVIDKKNKRIN